jgi:hypothetical protein
VGKHLNDQGGRFTSSSSVLPLAEPADVGQQTAQRGPVKVWKLLNKSKQLGGALVVTTDTYQHIFFQNNQIEKPVIDSG